MPLASLPAFEAAARHQSFSRAAEELNLTHGAISRAVAQIEERLDCALFVRRNRRVYLTRAGERLLAATGTALDGLGRAIEEIHRHDVASPILTVSCEPSLAMRWLMPRLGLFRENNPDLHIDLRLAGGPIDLLQDGCDIAIRRNDFGISDDYHVTHLWTERAGPVCDPDCWETILGRDLSRARWLHSRTRPDAWEVWKKASHYQGLPASEQYFDHFFFALQAAVNRLGTAIGPLPLVQDDLVAGRLIAPLGMAVTGFEYVLITLDGPSRDQRIGRFFDWLMIQAAEMVAPG
ncbi:LysR substrate-binding domain-containing protein [Thalassospira sp.]|uniref:LysR substrate-binding domain-containing protein n=1 Tax=Thalassospira sp. TaxID=1912094 RepID=UPI0027323829|nr:LysR substrate-binding domain-containing protein [Thalassospira sp.]MDP2699316.1 LysR substrate-binding domain-containing protein [Thalassospira sp.]